MKSKAGGDYAGSLRDLELALSVIQHDPSGVDWGPMEKEIGNEIEAVRDMKTDADKTARSQAARTAYRRIKEQEARRRLAEVEKQHRIFEHAMDAFDVEQYAKAEAHRIRARAVSRSFIGRRP